MNGYLSTAGEFLIGTLFELYIAAIMIRFLLQLVRADFRNPICVFLIKVTNPALKPLRRIIPGIGGIDMASIFLLITLQILKLVLLSLLAGISLAPAALAVISIGQLISLLLNVYMFSILIQVILSWVGGGSGGNPVVGLLHALTDPVMRPLRRLLPPIAGFDLSPIFAFILIGLLKIILVTPIVDIGQSLA